MGVYITINERKKREKRKLFINVLTFLRKKCVLTHQQVLYFSHQWRGYVMLSLRHQQHVLPRTLEDLPDSVILSPSVLELESLLLAVNIKQLFN